MPDIWRWNFSLVLVASFSFVLRGAGTEGEVYKSNDVSTLRFQ